MPKGRRDSAPAPSPTAIGNVPTRAAIVVIMIGRRQRVGGGLLNRGHRITDRDARLEVERNGDRGNLTGMADGQRSRLRGGGRDRVERNQAAARRADVELRKG